MTRSLGLLVSSRLKRLCVAIAAGVMVSCSVPMLSVQNAFADDISDVNNQIREASDKLENAQDKYNAAIQSRDDANAQIDVLKPQLDAAQAKLGEIAKWKYVNNASDIVSIFLGATDVGDLVDKVTYLQKTEQEKQRVSSEISDKEKTLEQQRETAEQAASEAQQIQSEAQSDLDSLNERLDQLREEQRESLGYSSRYGGGPAYNASAGSDVVDYALSRIGCPYVWGAAGPTSFDCSGLVVWSYAQIGVSLPHQTESLKAAADEIIPISESQPGDVLYRPGHVGIVTKAGGAEYVHAPTFGAYVRNTDSISWAGFTCALRFYH